MPVDASPWAPWEFELPPDRIASRPTDARSASRLMVPHASGTISHHVFSDLVDLLQPGDLLVANDTRVMAARLYLSLIHI